MMIARGASRNAATEAPARGRARLAAGAAADPTELPFIGLSVFTLLLYLRPQELFPSVFGLFPLVKIVALATMLVYFASQLARNAPLTIWTFELKMVLLIWLLGVAHLPVAAAPGDSLALLTDHYFKVVCIFTLMINLIVTPRRLRAMIKLVTICGTLVALGTILKYLTGEVESYGRVRGIVGGIFGNPNDLAIALNLLLPLAVMLMLTSRGAERLCYLACAALLGVAVVITFSRGGFIGLLAMAGALLWKLRRRLRPGVAAALAALTLVVFLAAPAGYGSRLSTILQIKSDKTGSAQERAALLVRAASIAGRHPVVGVGMGNFHIYSIKEKGAHNAYLEIAAELGLAGLFGYLVLIFAPLRSLRRIERQAAVEGAAGGSEEAYLTSIALQASFVAYIFCSLFASVQYLWFLYYLVGYAVALRGIQEGAAAGVTAAAGGVLWRARQPRVGLRRA